MSAPAVHQAIRSGRHFNVIHTHAAVKVDIFRERFRRGGEVSERQWRDVVAALRIQGPRLDESLLRTWAPRLGVDDLLERASREAGWEG